MSLPHCFVVTKEMVVGGATSGIPYKLLTKVTITAWGLDSYTTCLFHKYGWPYKTSQTSRGSTSHNTSSMKDLMLYGRRHCWITQRYCPCWRNPMVYDCGCVVIGIPTSSWPLLKWCCFGSLFQKSTVAGNPLPTSGSGRNNPPPPLDLRVPPYGSSWWKWWRWALHR